MQIVTILQVCALSKALKFSLHKEPKEMFFFYKKRIQTIVFIYFQNT